MTEKSRVWLIADTHFFDNAVAERRKKGSADAMGEEIIRGWNEKVAPGDLVYVLGDFVATEDVDAIRGLVAKLHGRKRLVLGNHDFIGYNVYVEAGFERVYDHPVIVNGNVILSHEPVRLDESRHFINAHGHMHGIDMNQLAASIGKPAYFGHVNVSVDMTGFAPLELNIAAERGREAIRNADRGIGM